MSRMMNWDDIPDRVSLEAGHYLFKIQDIKEIQDERHPGVLIYRADLVVEEPSDVEGAMHFERFQIGTDEDPEAKESQTRRKSIAARQLKALLKAAQVPMLDTDEATFAAAKGCRFVGKIGLTISKKDGNEYPHMKGYYATNSPEAVKVGMTTSAMLNGGSAGGGSAPVTAGGNGPVSTKIKCNECGEQVDRADYGKHLRESHRPVAN